MVDRSIDPVWWALHQMDEVQPGWTRSGWIARLEHVARCCEELHPQRAEELRAEARLYREGADMRNRTAANKGGKGGSCHGPSCKCAACKKKYGGKPK